MPTPEDTSLATSQAGVDKRRHPARKAPVISWAFWDWGSAAFNAVLVTFIFSVYLVDSVGRDVGTRPGEVGASQWYSWAIAIAGVFIALVAPIMGQRADLRGTRKRSLVMWTLITVGLMAALTGIANGAVSYFFIGITIMAIASVTFEFAEVSYFAMLTQISTKDNVGKISGFGWSMGYFGGIVLLLVCYFGFVSSGDGAGDRAGFLSLPTSDGWNIRLVALFAAVWFLVSALPVMLRMPEIPPRGGEAAPTRESIAASYRRLWTHLKDLRRSNPNALWFLIASAVFRDGLAGVFTFGALLAVSSYGLGADDVLIFGVAANVVSALGALAGGRLDDRLGPKPVILGSLILMIVDAVVLLFVDGPTAFWILGLILCLFVGPAQSSARSFLARFSTEETSGEMFGLYATTGRAVSWLAPTAFGVFVTFGSDDRFGILGIALILTIGGALLLRVRQP